MGQTCSFDDTLDASDNIEESTSCASARCSQMLADLNTRSGRVVCAGVGNAIYTYSCSTGKKLSTLEGHASPVTCLTSRIRGSDGGTWLFSGSVDKTVRRWDFDRGIELFTMKGHRGPVWSLLLCEHLFSASEDQTIIRWDPETGKELSTFIGHSGPVRLLVDLQGTLVSGSDDCKVFTWNTSGRVAGQIAHSARVTCLLATDNGVLFSGASDGSISKWEPQKGLVHVSLAGHTDWVTCLMCAEGYLLSGGRDQCIRRWCLETGALLATYELGTISFKRKTGFLVGMSDGTAAVSKSVDGEKFSKVDHEDGRVSLRTKSSRFLSATAQGEVSAGSEVLGQNEKFDLLDNGDGTISIRTSHGRYVAAAPDGAVVAKRSANAEAEEEEKFNHFFIEGHYSGVTCLLCMDGALLSGSADRSVKLWDLSSGMLLASLEGRTGVTCLLGAGGALYAGAARGAPLRLPRPKPPAQRLQPPSSGKKKDANMQEKMECIFVEPEDQKR